MPRRYTMTDLILRCQRRADMDGISRPDPSISRDEWCALISEVYGELCAIVDAAGLEYFETAVQLTSDGTNKLAEPVDHLSTVTLAFLIDATTGTYRALRELVAQERVAYSGTLGAGCAAEAFALVDDGIYLYPTPPAGQIYELRYVPQPPELTEFESDDVTPFLVDVGTPDGLSFLIWGVTIFSKGKSESDVSIAVAARDRAETRLRDSALERSRTQTRRVIVAGHDGRGSRDWRDE